jgi:hypothetical protein
MIFMLFRRTFSCFLFCFVNFRQIDNSHVTHALKSLMKNVQTNEDLDVSENELENLVCFFYYHFLLDFAVL